MFKKRNRTVCFTLLSSSSTLKTYFLIYLVEIAGSWMAAIVGSVDLFRVDDSSYLSTWGWSRYFENCLCIFFLLSSASSLLMRVDLVWNFRGNFLMAASCWISWLILSQYCSASWWIDFSPRVTFQFHISFRNCSSEFKK